MIEFTRTPLRFLPIETGAPAVFDVIRTIDLPRRGDYALSLWHGQMSRPGRWSMPEIATLVCETYGISFDDLKAKGKRKGLSIPRQHAMWLMKRQDHLSLSMIGRYLGGRDHTTVLHGAKAHEARLAAQGEAMAA